MSKSQSRCTVGHVVGMMDSPVCYCPGKMRRGETLELRLTSVSTAPRTFPGIHPPCHPSRSLNLQFPFLKFCRPLGAFAWRSPSGRMYLWDLLPGFLCWASFMEQDSSIPKSRLLGPLFCPSLLLECFPISFWPMASNHSCFQSFLLVYHI